MIDDKERAVELVRQGYSYRQAGRAVGVCHKTVMRWCKPLGVDSRHPFRKPRWVTLFGRPMMLSEISREYGIEIHTLRARLESGDSDGRLVRPVARHRQPKVYELGRSFSEMAQYADLARQIGIRETREKTGLPYGAIGAAVRGEWERLA